MFESLLVAIGDCRVRPERCPAEPRMFEQGGHTANIEVGLLLARKRGAREIFGGCRRPHRNRQVSLLQFFAEFPVGFRNPALDLGRDCGLVDEALDGLAP